MRLSAPLDGRALIGRTLREIAVGLDGPPAVPHVVANADVLLGVEATHVIVITPIPAEPASGGPERVWLAALRDELAAREAIGRRTTISLAAARTPIGPEPNAVKAAHADGSTRFASVSARRSAIAVCARSSAELSPNSR